MKHRPVLLSLILCLTTLLSQRGAAADFQPVAPMVHPADSDSLNFVRASIVIASPDTPIYSAFGHCALRMQCPSAGLDYCFSLEREPILGDYIKYLSGKNRAGVYAVPITEYLANFSGEGRGVKQYELNLTLPEKRLLWKHLDEAMMLGPVFEFNLMNTNCVQATYTAILQSLLTDSICYDRIPSVILGTAGKAVRYSTRHSPWAEFLFISIGGAAADKPVPLDRSLSPELIIQLFEHTRLVDLKTGKSRPMFRAQPTTLLVKTHEPKASWLTPTVFFALLLAFVAVVTWGEKRLGWHRIARGTDLVLLLLQTLAGLLLVYMAIASNLFGSRWNWYIIPFNPLPALLWLFCRKKAWYPKTYLVWTAVLLLFVLVMPLSDQFDTAHALLCLTLAMRTAAHLPRR